MRLVEYRDRFQLVPVPKVRSVYGYGKIKAERMRAGYEAAPAWDDIGPDADVWVVMEWFRYEDGHEEPGNIAFTHPGRPETEIRKCMEDMERFSNQTRDELLGLTQCFEAKEEDFNHIEAVRPNYQSEPHPSATDEYDVYHARLKVMSELQPKTVELIKIAHETKDLEKRALVENQAVQSYFAEVAHYLTEEEVLAWQRSNPVGTGWMCEFSEVMQSPRRVIDPVNYELALNWLKARYNEQSAAQLSKSILKRVFRWLTPAAIKKRRERLGLTTKRKPGSPEK